MIVSVLICIYHARCTVYGAAMYVNFRQIEAFYWAARLGSLIAAAKRLNTTQSAVSMRVLKLEEQFGVKLFDRSHRTARLTAKGHELLPYAEQLMTTETQMKEAISTPESLSGSLRIGVSETISMTWLPKFVRMVHNRYPKVVLNLHVGLAITVIEMLNDGTANLVLAPGNVGHPSVEKKSLGFVYRKLVASPSLGIPDGQLSPKDLQGMPIITLSKASAQQEVLEGWFRANQVRYRSIETCNSIQVALSLAIAGMGISLLPTQCYEKASEAGEVQVLNVEPSFEPIEYFAMLPRGKPSSLADQISDIAVEVSDYSFRRT